MTLLAVGMGFAGGGVEDFESEYDLNSMCVSHEESIARGLRR